MATEASEREARDRTIAALLAQRTAKAAELSSLDQKLQAFTDADFEAKVTQQALAGMTLRERSALVTRIGSEKFAELVRGRR